MVNVPASSKIHVRFSPQVPLSTTSAACACTGYTMMHSIRSAVAQRIEKIFLIILPPKCFRMCSIYIFEQRNFIIRSHKWQDESQNFTKAFSGVR